MQRKTNQLYKLYKYYDTGFITEIYLVNFYKRSIS